MSEDGVFINIDGNANRVAAYAHTKACPADCGYEQSRKIRGRRPAPCAE